MKRSAKLDLLAAILGEGSPFHGSKVSDVEVHGPFSLDDLLDGKLGQSAKQRGTEDDELLEALSSLIKDIVRKHLDDGSDVTDDEKRQGNELVASLNAATSMDEIDSVGNAIIALHNNKDKQRSIKVHSYYHAMAEMVLPVALFKFGYDGVKAFMDAHPDNPVNKRKATMN